MCNCPFCVACFGVWIVVFICQVAQWCCVKGELAEAFFSPWFQSRESLRPLLQDGNARKPLGIIHLSLQREKQLK